MLNSKVLDVVKTFPINGTHKYYWVDGFDGVTQDLVYEGVVIAKGDKAWRTYCCGLTFETFFKAKGGVGLGSVKDVVSIKRDWFVASGGRKGPVDALVHRGLADEVKLEDALPGDFCQIWRKSGSGHSVVFLSYDHVKKTLHYWSTQPSTNGIGERTEVVGPDNITEIYIARAR